MMASYSDMGFKNHPFQWWAIKITIFCIKKHLFQHTNDLLFSGSTVQRLPFLYFNILIIIIMSSTTSHSLPALFAMDPVRSSVRSLATDQIQLLNGPHHVPTDLIDYLLHHGQKDKLHPNLLMKYIGTTSFSNRLSIFQIAPSTANRKPAL
jgi:hypothetical protein